MTVHSDDRKITVHSKPGVSFAASCSHVESPDGKHLFVIAVADKPGTDQLIAARADFPAVVKSNFRISSNADLEYIERHPDGSLFKVNLETIGQGPGAHGEPGHIKTEAVKVTEDPVKARLGRAKLPTASPAPVYAQDTPDLNQSGLPRLSKKERMEARHEAKQVQKPRL